MPIVKGTDYRPHEAQCSKCYEISDMEFLIKIYNQIDILGISIDHFEWFTIILAIKSKRVENISPKYNKVI